MVYVHVDESVVFGDGAGLVFDVFVAPYGDVVVVGVDIFVLAVLVFGRPLRTVSAMEGTEHELADEG